MKKLLWVLPFLLLAGCVMEEGGEPEETDSFSEWAPLKHAYKMVRIENCQYLQQRTHGGSFIVVHKGNCDNPIHVYRKAAK